MISATLSLWPSQTLLRPIQHLLDDGAISEIVINKPQEVWFEKNGQFTQEVVSQLTELHLLRLFQLIANENQQRLNSDTPLLSGSLFDGSRVQLCLPPTTLFPTMAIRRKVAQQLSLADYATQDNPIFYRDVRPATLNLEKGEEQIQSQDQNQQNQNKTETHLIHLYQQQRWHEFIQSAILHKKTIVISGGTSSGKTTFLNACLRHIPTEERLIILEDTREIDTPHPNQVQLLAVKGEQGKASITMQDLVQCSLRLRPDRLIMGEVRGKEIIDFISSCTTGHEGGMMTLHANSPAIAFMRMTQLYKLNNVPSMTDADILRELKTVIDIVVQLSKSDEGRKIESIYYKHGVG